MPGFNGSGTVRRRGHGQDQNLSLQLDALKAAGCRKSFRTGVADHKASGSKTERPELSRLLEIIREGDTLTIWKPDDTGDPAIGSFPKSFNRDCDSVRGTTYWISQSERSYRHNYCFIPHT
ncbi:recombinase family protein [Spirosoma arboris]|uniref:recombinase family protein n=1 Tax=Spirosoma arboris TaxID=2682092 RepID=UPI001D11FA47|nr:recombinase family protein [Spirosoma arboris]